VIYNSPLTDGCVDEISRLLKLFSNGVVDPMMHKTNLGEIRFHFVTKDKIPIDFDVDLKVLRRKGRKYIDDGLQSLWNHIDAERKERQKQSRIVLLDS
jgi:hypothetical protein